MTNKNVLENRISLLEKYLNVIKNYQDLALEELRSNLDKAGAVERYLYLAIQSAIDLGEAFIAFRSLRKPTTLSETFYILNEEKVIDINLTEQLAKLVGFRNILSHGYEKINYEIVLKILKEDIKQLTALKEIIKNNL